jgi:hypothetical protein
MRQLVVEQQLLLGEHPRSDPDDKLGDELDACSRRRG